MKLNTNQKKLRRKLLTIIHEIHGSHIGSCLNVIDIIDTIYAIKKRAEKFILSNGHAGASLYVVLEKYNLLKNPSLNKLYIHPDRNPKIGIDVSTGSLGQGLPIALGIALANKKNNVYCTISDGECSEGSIWESMRLVNELKINNLKIILTANGWSAYDAVSNKNLKRMIRGFGLKIISINGHNIQMLRQAIKKKNKQPTIIFAKTVSDQFPFLKGLDAHYYKMTNEDYQSALEVL